MDEAKGLVSITIPFRNSERFLSEAIESVLRQTYARWELILVDDGSADRSAEIARRYAAKNPACIRCLQHPGHSNRGVNCARNLGVWNGRGEFVSFLDSDDVWLPFKLEQQVSVLNAHPQVGLVYGPSEYWYDWDPNTIPVDRNHTTPVAPGERIYSPPFLLANTYPLGPFGAPCTSSCLFRRSACEQAGGFDESFNPSTFQVFEDLTILAKIYLEFPVYVSETCQERYRYSPGSLWNSVKETSVEEAARQFYFRWLRAYLHETGVKDPDIWRAVRRQGWMYWLPLPKIATRFLRRVANRLPRKPHPPQRAW